MTATKAITSTPCAKCPWRVKFKGDDDYLRSGRRAGIMRDMLADATFPCHETIGHADIGDDYDELEVEDGIDYSKSVECAGAALVLLRAERSTNMLRVLERIGMVNLDELLERNADVELWTLRESLDEAHDARVSDEDEVETEGTCNVVNQNCSAPAGYMIGGEVVHGEDLIDTRCPECDEFVCEECSDDDGACLNGQCSQTDEDDDYDY